jgi:hypothetical protein
VSRGEADLIKALAAYEQDMIGYGFAAVQASLKNMERFHAKGIIARSATKALFRVIDYPLPAGQRPKAGITVSAVSSD